MRVLRAGFTLVELLLTLALLGALASLSVPLLHGLWTRQRLRLAADELAQTLQLVRAESQGRGRALKLCPSADGRSCASAGGWEQGWIALLETSPDRYAPQPLLVRRGWPGLRIRSSDSLGDALRFNAQGWLRAPAGALVFGDISLCPEAGSGPGRKLVISRSGRIRQESVECGAAGS